VASTADDDRAEASGAFLDCFTLPPRAVAAEDDYDDDKDNKTGGDGNSCFDVDFNTPEAEERLVVPLTWFDCFAFPVSPLYCGIDAAAARFSIISCFLLKTGCCSVDDICDFGRYFLIFGFAETESRCGLIVGIVTRQVLVFQYIVNRHITSVVPGPHPNPSGFRRPIFF
jgi:hypothetical protein